MRLYQQIRASIARSAVAGAGVAPVRFRHAACPLPDRLAGVRRPPGDAGRSGRTSRRCRQGTPLSIDEAVRMALENNLGIQVEKLNPQIQVLGVSRADAAYAPSLLTDLTPQQQHGPADRLQHVLGRPADLDQRATSPTTAASSSC